MPKRPASGHAAIPASSIERGVALLEAMRNPQLDAVGRIEAFERTFDMLETSLARDDEDAAWLLGLLVADAPRFRLTPDQRKRAQKLAHDKGATAPTTRQRQGYELVRGLLLERDAADDGSVPEPVRDSGEGADNVPLVVAEALVELRAKCAALCELVPEAAAFMDAGALPDVTALVAEIFESAEVAQMRLARKPATIKRSTQPGRKPARNKRGRATTVSRRRS